MKGNSPNFSGKEPVTIKLFSKSFEGSRIRSAQHLTATPESLVLAGFKKDTVDEITVTIPYFDKDT